MKYHGWATDLLFAQVHDVAAVSVTTAAASAVSGQRDANVEQELYGFFLLCQVLADKEDFLMVRVEGICLPLTCHFHKNYVHPFRVSRSCSL